MVEQWRGSPRVSRVLWLGPKLPSYCVLIWF